MPYEKTGKETRCIADEIPFEIPDSWTWSRIGSCIELVNGRAYKQSELLDKGKYRVLRVGNFFTNSSWYYSDLELPSDKYCHEGDLLYAWSASFGPRIWDQGKTIFHYHIWNVKFDERLFLKEFLFYFLLWDKERLKGSTTGSTMIHISMEHMYPRFIMIPPLAEQKRIVAKIEELLPHLEEYDQAETRVEKLNAEFPEQLKKSILQWAIQGKLVPQDPNDEPASVLLDRIRAEKAKLVKAGKIKKDKTESSIFRRDNSHYTVQDGKEVSLDDKLPFEIPLSWSWVKLKELLEQASTGPFGSMLHKSDYVESGIPLVNPANIEGTQISDIGIKKVSIKTAERLQSYKLLSGDVIIGRRGELGRSAVVLGRAAGWLCGTGCFFVTTKAVLLPDYLVFLLASPYIREALMGKAVGTTMNNLNHGILGNLLVPLPPKQEQRRILMQWEVLIKRFFCLIEFSL